MMGSKILSTEENIEIGRRIEARRKVLDVSSRELGQELGVSYQQIYKYESGQDRISISKLNKVAKLLYTDITYFIPDTDKLKSLENSIPEKVKLLENAETLKFAKFYISISDTGLRRAVQELLRSIAKRNSQKNY